VGILGRAAIAAPRDGTLGLERELRRAAAGVRTYGLVGMGSAAFIAAAILIAQETETDPSTSRQPVAHGGGSESRMTAGLVAGVGAPGAGAILRTDERLRGDKDEHRMAGVAGTEHRRMEAPDIAQADPRDQPPFNGTHM
jgi:putative Mg2+ transporter-C (MgtC) family protein